MKKLFLIILAISVVACVSFAAFYVAYFDSENEYGEKREEISDTSAAGTEPDTQAVDIIIETEPQHPEESESEPKGSDTESITCESEQITSELIITESDTLITMPTPETEYVTDEIIDTVETDVPNAFVTEEISETVAESVTDEITDLDIADVTDLPEDPVIQKETNDRTEIVIPILMYHALTENESEASSTVITVDAFENQIAAMTESGYTSIFFKDLLDYVERGINLPEKPVLITFDDGYLSNLELAGPVLEKYGHRATVSVIGVSVGKKTYKDTGISIYPHFSLEEAKNAYEDGTFDFQSHTYDMHQNGYDIDPRHGMLQKENESEDEYIAALSDDFKTSKEQLECNIGNEVFVITYPHGRCTELTDRILLENGARISVTVEYGVNVIKVGEPETLRFLCRINMDDNISGQKLIEILENYVKEEGDS